jgi:hypothetical protein
MDQLPLENFENSRIELLGRMVDYGKKGEFLKSLINLSWNNSLYVLTSVFDLEIEN